MSSRALFLVSLVFCFPGCGEDSGEKDTDVEFPDTGDPPGDPTTPWNIADMPGEGDVSEQAYVQMAVSGTDELSVAYFLPLTADGECDGIDALPPYPTRERYDIRVATKASGGDWSLDIADSPLYNNGTRGVRVGYSDPDTLMVAYAGGEPDPAGDMCLSGDAYLATRQGGAWTQEAAGTESGDSPSEFPESQNGYLVGFWPGLAFDADGEPAMVYQDVHFLRHGENRNDAEFAWRQGGGWTHELVDQGAGAGEYNALIFDAANRPIAFYSTPQAGEYQGVWASRRNDAGEWERVRIHNGTIQGPIAAVLDPEYDEPVAAMYAENKNQVKIVRLVDDERFTDSEAWNIEYVGQNGLDEGKYVSMAFSPNGDLALAYYRCRRLAVDENCNSNDDGLVFAIKHAGTWSYEVVDDGDQAGECGIYSALAFTSDGTAHIAYLCNLEDMGERHLSLYVADKKIEGVK